MQLVANTLAALPDDHQSGLGCVLARDECNLHVAYGVGDHADQICAQYNGRDRAKPGTVTGEMCASTTFLQCWPHLAKAIPKRAWNGTSRSKHSTHQLTDSNLTGATKEERQEGMKCFMQAAQRLSKSRTEHEYAICIKLLKASAALHGDALARLLH